MVLLCSVISIYGSLLLLFYSTSLTDSGVRLFKRSTSFGERLVYANHFDRYSTKRRGRCNASYVKNVFDSSCLTFLIEWAPITSAAYLKQVLTHIFFLYSSSQTIALKKKIFDNRRSLVVLKKFFRSSHNFFFTLHQRPNVIKKIL
jgi:hypothetical protein